MLLMGHQQSHHFLLKVKSTHKCMSHYGFASPMALCPTSSAALQCIAFGLPCSAQVLLARKDLRHFCEGAGLSGCSHVHFYSSRRDINRYLSQHLQPLPDGSRSYCMGSMNSKDTRLSLEKERVKAPQVSNSSTKSKPSKR